MRSGLISVYPSFLGSIEKTETFVLYPSCDTGKTSIFSGSPGYLQLVFNASTRWNFFSCVVSANVVQQKTLPRNWWPRGSMTRKSVFICATYLHGLYEDKTRRHMTMCLVWEYARSTSHCNVFWAKKGIVEKPAQPL